MVLEGYLDTDLEQRIPCHFEGNRLTLYFEKFEKNEGKSNPNAESDNNHFVKVWKRGMLAGGCYLMHLFTI